MLAKAGLETATPAGLETWGAVAMYLDGVRRCALGFALAVGLAAFVPALAILGAAPANAGVEYVKVCELYGAGFYYIPGTDTCLKVGGTKPVEHKIDPQTVCSRYGAGYYYLPGQGTCRNEEDDDTAKPASYGQGSGYTGWVGGTWSLVSQNSIFGSGTVVKGGEYFGARVPGSISRAGFEVGGRLDLPGSGWIVNGSGYVNLGLSYANGSASDSGTATIGVDGVTQLGQTYLEAIGPTGVFTSTPGNYMDSTASVSNSWAVGTLGYGECSTRLDRTDRKRKSAFPRCSRALISPSRRGPRYSTQSPLTLLSTQDTNGQTADRYYGLRFDAGMDYRIAPAVSIGFSGYVTPAYHTGSGSITQFTSFSSVSQDLAYNTRSFTWSGGIGAHVSWRPAPNTTLRLSFEHSCLGDVTQLNVPENPTGSPPISRAVLSVATSSRGASPSASEPHGHFATGGIEERIEATLPPVLRPNTVPRS